METTNYIGTTERAAIIRAALKAKGWSSRDVSVRADHFSMGSAIRISVKNAAVPLAEVEAIASEHESISRDANGDILSGGNRYIDVSYNSEARKALADKHLPAVSAAADRLNKAESESILIPITLDEETGFFLGRGRHGHGFSLWKDGGHEAEVSNLQEAALVVGMGGRR